jgi:ATP-dependent RNA helicase DOB1
MNNNNKKEENDDDTKIKYIVDVLLRCRKMPPKDKRIIEPALNGENSEAQIVGVTLDSIKEISSIRIFLPKDLKGLDSRQTVSASLKVG